MTEYGQAEPWGGPPGGASPSATLLQMAGTLAHDMNNVLTVIAGNLALAERHAAGNEKLIRLLYNMRLAAERGARLTHDLLALSPGSQAEGSAGPAFSEPGRSSRILIVEDDPQVAEVARTVLEDMGHVVSHSPDAASALSLLRADADYDLMFSDIVMPGGMSGIELAELVAQTFPRLPILLATGYSSAALTTGALRFPVLAKPYSVQELSRRVAQMLPPGTDYQPP